MSAGRRATGTAVLEKPPTATEAAQLPAARAPKSGLAASPKSAREVVEAGSLERLRREGPGAARTFAGLEKGELQKLGKAAEEVGLARKEEADGSLTVYAPGDELVFGVVPYAFEELGLHADVVLALLQWAPRPIEKATHIQAAAIPKILAGEDVAIQAETGSGKTLAYLLPAAHRAVLRAEGTAPAVWRDAADVPEGGGGSASCYRVEMQAGPQGVRPRTRPEEIAPFARKALRVGDEFVARSVSGSPLGLQFIEMADGRGWVPWDRRDMRHRLSLSAVEFRAGQRVEARERLEYGSGDVVEPGTQGTVERLAPLVGVRWDGLEGIKAVRAPRRALGSPKVKKENEASKWARCAPETVIITATRELCEQTADVARQLGKLLPEHAQKEWTVAVAVGAPPGVGKNLKRGKEQWPFPKGAGAPRVLVTTLEFMGYFFHKRHVPLWGGIRYMVYDEVDRLVAGPERVLLNRVKVMFLRSQRAADGSRAQNVLVASTMPSQGTKSTRLQIGRWMPAALRALPRPDLLHRQHPMVLQSWRLVPGEGPECLNEKVRLLVEYLEKSVGTVQGEAKRHRIPKEKTIVFCNDAGTAAELAERLATTHLFERTGLMVSKVGNDERRERMRMFRDGRIMLMVCTDILSRGIDVPDLECVVQFDFSRNITGHLHRIGRASRGGSRGRAMNFFDDSEQGGRSLAEAIQELGGAPLDGLFSRNRGFKKGLRRTEAFRDMLLTQGLPLPEYLQEGGPRKAAPLLADSLLREVEDEDEDSERIEDLPEYSAFDQATDEDKDGAFLGALQALHEAAEEQNAEAEEEEEGSSVAPGRRT